MQQNSTLAPLQAEFQVVHFKTPAKPYAHETSKTSFKQTAGEEVMAMSSWLVALCAFPCHAAVRSLSPVQLRLPVFRAVQYSFAVVEPHSRLQSQPQLGLSRSRNCTTPTCICTTETSI